MQAQRLNITLPADLAADFRRKVPSRSRSKFIAAALREELKKKRNLKKEWIKSIKANRKLYKEIQEDFKYVDAEAFEKLP